LRHWLLSRATSQSESNEWDGNERFHTHVRKLTQVEISTSGVIHIGLNDKRESPKALPLMRVVLD
jgi:hypothetical protein